MDTDINGQSYCGETYYKYKSEITHLKSVLATNFNNIMKEIENGLPSVIVDPKELKDTTDFTFVASTGPWRCRTCQTKQEEKYTECHQCRTPRPKLDFASVTIGRNNTKQVI